MRKIVLALGILTVLGINGCAHDQGIDETGYSKKPLVDRQGHKLKSADAKRLYKAGRDFLIHDQPKKALRLYAEVNSRFPFSPYAAQSELEAVDAHYQAGNYDDTVEAADRFIKQRPRNPHIDYVYYLRGLADYAHNKGRLLNGDPDRRNTRYLKQAFNDFSLLVKNYPNSAYAKDAQLHMIAIRNRLAKFDLRIASYYLSRHAYVGASRRAENIITRYQGSDSVPRALEIMEECYAKLQLPGLAEDTRAVLQTSYPNYILNRSEFYRQQSGQKPHYKLPDVSAPPSTDRSDGATGGQSGGSNKS